MFNFATLSQRNHKFRRPRSCRPRLEWMEPRTLLSAVTWTGSAGDNNWDTPQNWSTDSVPGSGDDVTIDIAANIVHSDNVSDSINSLTSNQPLTISGGTLSIASASTIGALTISGGTLTAAGEVSVSGLVTLDNGTLSGSGALNANGGMVIDPTNGNLNLDGCTVNNAAGATATWTGSLDDFIEASNGSVFNNLGTFVALGLGLYNQTTTGAASTFNDTGSFIASANSTNPANVGFDMPFSVQGGSVDVQNGAQLDLDNGGTVTNAAFDDESGGVLDLEDYNFDTASTISGTGTLELGAIVLPGNYTYAGSGSADFGTIQVDGSFGGLALNLGDSGTDTLSGTGTVGAVFVGAGDVGPGDGTNPGILNADGNVQFVAVDNDSGQGSIYSVALNGPAAGTGYSQLNVTGQVSLGGSEFNPFLDFTPSSGEQFTIIKSTEPIVGTFAGLPQGASLTLGNTAFTISYSGGDGDDVVLTQATTAVAAPTVTGVSPNSGPAAGGTAVTITGTGFTGATAVEFGTTAATGLVVVNSTTITANSPSGSGVANVTVVTPAGTSATSAADQFTYNAAVVVAAPTVTGVSPDSGPTAGGTTVTITGSNFTGATADVVVVNATTITAVSPAGAGVADVTVVTSAGASAATPSDQFTYVAPTTTVVSVKRFGFHMLPTKFVLTFNGPLDAARADNPASYSIVNLADPGEQIRIGSATYNAAAKTVTLLPIHRLYLYDHYKLTVADPESMAAGDPANGGTTGDDFVTTVSPANLVLTPSQQHDGALIARTRLLSRKFPGLKHLVDGRARRPRA
jgi:large repetitive protein